MRCRWRLLWLMLLCAVALPIAGCWNSRELSNLALVVGMGIDKGPKENEYRVSFQVVNPGAIGNGSKGSGGGGTMPVSLYTGTENTIFGALRATSQKVPRQLFFAHIQLLIIGESLAREGLNDLFDFIDRSHELRMNMPVVIAREQDAESVLRIITPLENNPATGIAKRLELTSEIFAVNAYVETVDVIQALMGSGEPSISGVRIDGDPRIGQTKRNLEETGLPAALQISGLGLFKDGKLVAWQGRKEARGTLWIQNKMKGTVLEFACDNKKEGVSVELTRSVTDISVKLKNGRPTFRVRIQEEGNITEVLCPIDLSKRDNVVKLQKKLAETTKHEVRLAVESAQRVRSDVFGFGEEVSREHPEEWKHIEKIWPDLFADCEVEIEVEAFIRRTGMRTKPYFMGK
jgi:spore germination protein KC